MNTQISRTDLAALAEQVAHGLSQARLLEERAYIRTPVLLPSGSSVVVVIEAEGGGHYRVSELGQGLEEAVQMGCAGIYRRQAQEAARLAGLAFEKDSLLLTGLEADQLVAATTVVANAAARAVERAAVKAADRAEEGAVLRLVSRLERIFPEARVRREAELRGASTHPWRVDALVETARGKAVFNLVAANAVSVAVANTKFHDLALLEDAPTRVAVVRRKAALGDLVEVLAQAARVVEDDAPDRAFARAAVLAA